MKLTLVIFALVFLASCGTAKVNVDLNSCSERGVIDGIRVAECQPVKVVK